MDQNNKNSVMWLFSIVAVSERIADAFVEALDDLPILSAYAQTGPATADRTSWIVNILSEEEHLPESVSARIRHVADSQRVPEPALAAVTLPQRDWVAASEEGLGPIQVGRFYVHGKHVAASRDPAMHDIVVEAGRAFGSGHHHTTRGCLRAIENIARRQHIAHALDLGTGSGVLAIAIVRRLRTTVTAIDIDPIAITVARENVRYNNVGKQIVTAVGDGRSLRSQKQSFDLIVANILAEPLIALAPVVARVARPSASLVLSGILLRQQAAVAATYRRFGFVVVSCWAEGEWPTLLLKRRQERLTSPARPYRPIN